MIQKAIQDRIIVTGWSDDNFVSSLLVERYKVNSVYWSSDPDDHGFHTREDRLKFVDPTVAIKRDLEKVKKEYEESLKKAADATKARETADKRVKELEDQLLKLGEVK